MDFLLVKLFFVILLLTCEYRSMNTRKSDEFSQATSFLAKGQSFNRLPYQIQDSTKGKISQAVKRLVDGMEGTEKVGESEDFHDGNGKIKEEGLTVESSLINGVYVSKNEEKANKESRRRVRKDIEMENKTRQVVQCEVPSLSCQNCCEGSNSNCGHKTKFCRCDPQCSFYNDCCVDYETFCGKKQLTISFGVPQEEFSCSKPKHVDIRSDSDIWLVNKCPKDRQSDDISRKCENADKLELNISNMRTLVPVLVKNNVIFRNEFCAKCNGIEDFEYFGFNVTCYLKPPFPITSVTELMEFATNYCESMKGLSIFRRQSQPVRECNQYFRNICPTLKELNEKCREQDCTSRHWCDLRFSVWNEVPYKTCREMISHDDSDDLAGPSRPTTHEEPFVPPFLVLSLPKEPRVSQVIMNEVKCPSGLFYDEYLETCRHGEAIPLVKENLDKYFVAVWLDIRRTPNHPPNLNETVSSLAKLFNFEQSQASDITNMTIGNGKMMVLLFKLQLSTEQTLRLAKRNDSKMKDSFSHFGNDSVPLERLLFFSAKFNITVSNETFIVFKTTSRQLSCVRKQIYPKGNYMSIENGEYYYINSTNQTFSKSQVFLEETTNNSISVCEKIVFSNCVGRRIVLTSEEYVKFDNLSIYCNRTRRIYNLGEYDIEDGKILICIPIDPPNLPKRLFRRNSNIIQTYLTLICFILSLICLYLVIQTYVIFSELRNLPGRNLLSLSISLFLGQLLWLPTRSYTPTACHVVAAMEHYLFLVSFVAMATIAWHTHSVFATKDVRRGACNTREHMKFCKYSAMVWGLPALFVATCAVIDQLDVYAVYVNEQWCFIENAQALLYLFVLPVGLLLLFNFIFFALTVFHIHRARSSSAFVRPDEQPHSMVRICLKLSALMGFSWLFGFIDLWAESALVFSYLFIIFASLQGVYIAVAFVMKREIWEKYKKLFTGKRTNFKPDYGSELLKNLSNTRETRV